MIDMRAPVARPPAPVHTADHGFCTCCGSAAPCYAMLRVLKESKR